MDYSHLPIFSTPPPPEGEERKQSGMDRAQVNANDEWKVAALRIIRHYAQHCEYVSVNDLWAGMETLGLSTHENRASGPIFVKAAKLGWIEKTNTTIKTTRVERNSGDVRLWRSLLFSSNIASS